MAHNVKQNNLHKKVPIRVDVCPEVEKYIYSICVSLIKKLIIKYVGETLKVNCPINIVLFWD